MNVLLSNDTRGTVAQHDYAMTHIGHHQGDLVAMLWCDGTCGCRGLIAPVTAPAFPATVRDGIR